MFSDLMLRGIQVIYNVLEVRWLFVSGTSNYLNSLSGIFTPILFFQLWFVGHYWYRDTRMNTPKNNSKFSFVTVTKVTKNFVLLKCDWIWLWMDFLHQIGEPIKYTICK